MKPTLIAIALLLTSSYALAAAPGSPGGLPPGANEAKAVLEKSPRHGEWVDIEVPGEKTPVKSYVVYPEREGQGAGRDRDPRDLRPERLDPRRRRPARGRRVHRDRPGPAQRPRPRTAAGPTRSADRDDGDACDPRRSSPRKSISRLNAVRDYGLKLPAANGKTRDDRLLLGRRHELRLRGRAARPERRRRLLRHRRRRSDGAGQGQGPGRWASTAATTTASPQRSTPTTAEMKTLGKTYEPHVFEGAGHGFLRQQDGQNGANMKATQEAWPATIKFLREHTK